MILILHIIVAIASLGYTTYLLLKPSKNKLKVSYSLVAGTLLSGTVLVAVSHVSILRSCITGLVYTTIVSASILVAQRRLARLTINEE